MALYSPGGLNLADTTAPLILAYNDSGSTDVVFLVSSSGDLTITPDGNDVTVAGDLTVTGAFNASASGIILGDDEELYFGTGSDYWFQYDSGNTQFELMATNVNGSGTDGIVFSIDDGSDDVVFTGNITATNLTVSGNAALGDAAGDVHTVIGTLNWNDGGDSAVQIANAGTNASSILAGSSDILYLGGNATQSLLLDASGNATFAGDVTVGSDGSGADVIFYSDTAGDHFFWDSSGEKLTITGSNAQTALDIADGNVVISDALTVQTLTATGTSTLATVTISNDLDVDGITNLDVVDIDGAVDMGSTLNVANAFTVGTDGSGADVYFHSATGSDHLFWDASEEKLTITGTNGQTALNVADGNVVVADTLTATALVGPLTGNASTATLATLATTVTITDNESTSETNAVIFTAGGALTGGNLGLESDGTFNYNPSTGAVTATSFIGALNGTANVASTISTATTTDSTCSVALFESTSGNQAAKTDAGLTYNASSNVLAGTFNGNLTGNVTGNASGTAATVTGAAQSAITSVGALTSLSVTGDVGIGTASPATSNGDIDQLVEIRSTTSSKNTVLGLGYTGGSDSQWSILESRNLSAGQSDLRVAQISLGNEAGNQPDRGAITFYTWKDGTGAQALILNHDQIASFASDVRLAPTKKLYLDDGGDTYIHENSANSVQVVAGGSTGFFFNSGGGGVVATDKLWLDGGDNTYITEAGSDSCSWFVGGTERFRVTTTYCQSNIDLYLSATKKLYLDGGTHTYLSEGSADTLDIFAGGNHALRLTTASVQIGPGGDYDLMVWPTKKLYLDGGGNTYIVESAGDTMSFFTVGSERLTIASSGALTTSGNLSIGGLFIMPAAEKFYLDGGGNTYIDEVSADSIEFVTGGTQRVRIENAGLDVESGNLSTSSGIIYGTNSGSGWNSNLILTNTYNDASPSMIILDKIRSGTSADNDYVGGILFKGRNDANEAHNFVEQFAQATDVSNGSESSKWRIGTWASGTEYANTLVAREGNVGCGTASPGATLEVYVQSATALKVGNMAGSSQWQAQGADGNASYPFWSFYNDPDTGMSRQATNSLSFNTGGTERMRIIAAGHVGIPTGARFYLDDLDGGGDTYIVQDSNNVLDIYTSSHALRLDGNQNMYLYGPSLTIGSGAAEDLKILFHANNTNFYMGVDQSDLDFKIGTGSTLGSGNLGFFMQQDTGNVCIGADNFAVGSQLTVQGNDDTITANFGSSLSLSQKYNGIGFGHMTKPKAGIFFKRTSSYSVGDLYFLINGEMLNEMVDFSDDNDISMRIGSDKSITSYGRHYMYQDLSVLAQKKFWFDGGNDTYMWEHVNQSMQFIVGNVEVARWNVSEVMLMKAYSATSSSAANVYVDSGGKLYRSTSSIEYKQDVEDYTLEDAWATITGLRPISYRTKEGLSEPESGETPFDHNRRHLGFIAEEVDEVEQLLVKYRINEEGEEVPDALEYNRIAAPLVKVIQDLLNRIEELED